MLAPFSLRFLRLVAWVTTALTMSACRRELQGRPAPDGELFFPLGLAVSADQRFVYVVSTNWSQRFNTGWLSVFDLQAIATGAATTPAEAQIQRLLVPSLGGELTLSPDGTVLIVGFRNNSQIGVFEVQADGTLSCGDPAAETGLDASDRRTDCDARHIYRFQQRDLDDGFVEDQFRDPYGVRFLPTLSATQPSTELPTIVIGYLSNYLGLCLVTLLDVNVGAEGEILENQRSIELTQGDGDVSVQSSAVVAAYPRVTDSENGVDSPGRFIAIGARISEDGVTSASVIGIDVDNFTYASDQTDDENDDFDNRARIARIDIRSQAGGFTFSDMIFTSDGERAFGTISYPQPTSGSSDSVVMLDARPRSREIVLSDDSLLTLLRPEYDVLDTVAIAGTPQSVGYIERDDDAPLIATATFEDNAMHFVRVTAAHIDTLTRIDRSVGEGPVTVRHAKLTLSGESAPRTFVIVASFLSHGVTMFDVTSSDPSLWTQTAILSALPDGSRYR